MAAALGALVLAVGAALLLWGAEEFMEHVAALARRVGLPVVAMGLLLAGAEPEELTTALTASLGGSPTLAVTDALGANVTMATLGLGLAVLVSPVVVDATLRLYAALAALAGVGALVALWDGHVGRVEASFLVAAYVALVVVVWRRQRTPPLFGELAEDDESEVDEGEVGAEPAWRAGGAVLLGLAAMVAGGMLAVEGADRLATAGGLGEEATGLTALAFATSVEVLALVWAARRRALTPVAVGGVLGSVLYNATLTLGAAALVRPLDVPDLRWVAVAGALVPLAVLVPGRGGRLPRVVGAVLAAAYVAYLVIAVRIGAPS